MIFQASSGLAIRQATTEHAAEHTQLPSISQAIGTGDALGIYVDQRLPSISDLLRDMPPPPPPAQPRFYSSFTGTTLPTPISSPTSPFSTSHPTWPSLPPRPRSVPGYHPGPMPPPLGPRRASADCLTTSRSLSVPVRTSSPYYTTLRVSPDTEHHPHHQYHHYHHQRRASKQRTRQHQHQHQHRNLSTTPPPSPPTHHSSSATTPLTTPITTEAAAAAAAAARQKRNNKPYTFEQEAFIIYHRIDLDLAWEQVRTAYMARWPGTVRTVSGLECSYYRTNLRLPATTSDGLLLLVDPSAVSAAGGEGMEGGGVVTPPGLEGEEGEVDGEEGVVLSYRGVAYRTKRIKCRKARVSLVERFPEELVDGGNEWVRGEHRVMARAAGEFLLLVLLFVCLFGYVMLTVHAAERRRLQREEFLAARAGRTDGVMYY